MEEVAAFRRPQGKYGDLWWDSPTCERISILSFSPRPTSARLQVGHHFTPLTQKHIHTTHTHTSLAFLETSQSPETARWIQPRSRMRSRRIRNPGARPRPPGISKPGCGRQRPGPLKANILSPQAGGETAKTFRNFAPGPDRKEAGLKEVIS